mmetsp:Transcript_30973/g.52494  ORF Transcript_30973/g.52494 Transcript_30973/m.52494 type:complete len:206 (+) Transcript_30973:592-1209(+)
MFPSPPFQTEKSTPPSKSCTILLGQVMVGLLKRGSAVRAAVSPTIGLGYKRSASAMARMGVHVLPEPSTSSHPRMFNLPPATRNGFSPAFRGAAPATGSCGVNITSVLPVKTIFMEVLSSEMGRSSDISSSPWTKMKGVERVDLWLVGTRSLPIMLRPPMVASAPRSYTRQVPQGTTTGPPPTTDDNPAASVQSNSTGLQLNGAN